MADHRTALLPRAAREEFDAVGALFTFHVDDLTKKLARAVLDKRKTQVAENRKLDVKKVSKTTFSELCDEFWKRRGRQVRFNGLQSMIGIWKAHFGDRPVKAIRQSDIEDFLNSRMDTHGITAATRNRHLAMLKSMFNKAVQWKHLDENPGVGIEMLRESPGRTRFLDKDEIRRLLETASDSLRPILILGLHTGMRRGEILGLRWEDVDLKIRMISVRVSKSGEGRMIPIDDTLAETLVDLSSRFQKGYVFPSPCLAGRPMTDFNQPFRRVARKAEIQNIRFHDLRHTFASHLVMNGVDIRTVQELLGHRHLTMTMRYANLSPDHQIRSAKVLDSAYRTDTKTAQQPKKGSAGRSKLLK